MNFNLVIFAIAPLLSLGLIANLKWSQSPEINLDLQPAPVLETTANIIPETTLEATAISSPQLEIQLAQAQPMTQQVFYTNKAGIAIDGTDPVAYFQVGQPVPGKSALSHRWMNATWYFSSAENRDKFIKSPATYAPQYGGFCAWAVSQGYTAPITPDAWKVVDGKLYLNYDKRVQQQWQQDIPGNIAKANQNWPKLLADLIR